MLPVVALVGRPNVGKSTLFNVITGTRDALVADLPGLTRDRKYGYGRLGPTASIVIDTGGLVETPAGIEQPMVEQTRRAIDEADRIIFVVDGRAGITATDRWVVDLLRRTRKPVIVAVNKAEGIDDDLFTAEFHAFGLGEPVAISAAHGQGVYDLMARALEGLVPEAGDDEAAEVPAPEREKRVRVCVVGRPNVGKSTLINRWLGEERLVAFDQPGTTRDTVHVPFERDGNLYDLIDTAGVRRKARIEEAVEKFSVVKTLQAIEEAHVVVGVLDASETVGDQDASLLGFVASRGRALVIAVNKWDHIPQDQREHIKNQIALRLPFVDYAPLHFISARHGTGVGELLRSVDAAYESAMKELPTKELTRLLESAMEAHQPPLVRGRRIKLRYAHQGGRNPPLIIIHGNQVERVPDTYRRYLVNMYRTAYKLVGTPVKVEFRGDENPFAGRKNELTPRQVRKRRRLIKRNQR
jgi:GTPase